MIPLSLFLNKPWSVCTLNQKKSLSLNLLIEALTLWREKKTHPSEPMPSDIWILTDRALAQGVNIDEICKLTGLKKKRVERRFFNDYLCERTWKDTEFGEIPETPESPALVQLKKNLEEVYKGDEHKEIIKQYDFFEKPVWQQLEESFMKIDLQSDRVAKN
jgi:hypothetical protein